MSMTFRPVSLAVSATISSLLLLTACSGNDVKHSLGLKRNNPDEFQVVSRPPLSVPPVYHLRPPSEGAPEQNAADSRARDLVVGTPSGGSIDRQPIYQGGDQPESAVTPVHSSELASQGEETFLQNAGAAKAKADIRQQIYQENQPVREVEEEVKEGGFFKKLKIFQHDQDPVVDAKGEAERIAKNKEENKPLNEGEVKEIDPDDQGVLDRLF